MLRQVNSSTLAELSEQDRLDELAELVEQAKSSNGKATAYLRNRVRKFEMRYEMTSEEMLRTLQSGEQKETAEMAEWLFLLNALASRAEAPDHGG